MLGKTSEEIIHMIDNQTPANKIYDTLVPIKLTLNIGSATMDLRDYPEKMFYLPESTDDPERPSLKFDVSVFITEQDPNEECKRWVEVKYFHGRRSEKVLRTINPVKMYYNAKCVIQTNQRAYFVWGYSIDPVFTHILQTISAFSKDCYDPSEKLAWWDKIRLNFHGSMDLVITQGCELDAHILGSFSPYYTLNSDYFGNDGVNIVFSKGVNIKLGDTGVENEALRICCGELKCTIPRMGKEQYYEDYFNDDILNEIINNEIIFKLSGDVHISIICTFDPVIDNYFTEKRNHNELFLKLPEFATPYPNTMVFDSFSGFRTKFIHLKINLSSPSNYYAGLNYQHNYFHLTLDAINYLINFTEFMSTGFLALPVGVGPLFDKNADKKIPMDISEISMKINLMPLMIGISSFINDECYSNDFMIGIRCKAQTLNMEFNLLNQDNNGLDFTFSNAIITSLEGKIYTSGNAVSDEAKLYSFKGNDPKIYQKKKKKYDDDDTDDIYCWSNDLDKIYIHKNMPINSKHFLSSAYISYFKRNAIGDQEKLKKEYQIIENDISRVQIDLIQKRYFEIEILIRKLVEHQNNMELNSNKFEQSVDIVDLLATLYEKKKILKEQMEKEESSIYFNNEPLDSPNDMDTGLFNNIFIVHNICIIWNEAVRNIIFKMVHLSNRNNLLHIDMTYKLEKEMKKIIETKNSSINNNNNIESPTDKVASTPFTFEDQKHHDSIYNIIMNNNNSNDDELKTKEKLNINKSNSSLADELLQKLISEQNTHFVVTERDNNSNEDDDTIEFPEIQKKSDKYICSRNESSPDYIAPHEKAINSMIINFINPQICFEVPVDYIEKKNDLSVILLVAKSAQFRNIDITDLNVEDFNYIREEEIIKRRIHVTLQDAQLNSAHRSKRNKFPLSLVLNTTDGKLEWPLWVPLECIFDSTSHSGIIEHIADRFNGNVLSDTYNPSYVKPTERSHIKNTRRKSILGNNDTRETTTYENKNNTNLTLESGDINNNNNNSNNNNITKNGTLKFNTKRVCADNDNEIDTTIIAIKECNLYATSLQYCTIYNVIFDLFTYTEPNVLKMEDCVQKLVFKIEQLDDLNAVLENIYIMKNNIQMLNRSIVQIDWEDFYNENNGLEDLSAMDARTKYNNLQEHLVKTQDELLNVVLALKKIGKIRNSTKKNSTKIRSKFIYMSKDLTYNMLLDNSVPYCECLVKDIKYQIDTLEDKTNVNTIELRKIIVHNLLEKDNIYMNALVPYLPHQREYMENTKEKMFRLYYRENPAIGGIPIIDHFEINVIPILLQITNKLVNHLLLYVFPDRYKKGTDSSCISDNADEKLNNSDIDSIIYYSFEQQSKKKTDNEALSESKSKKKSNKSITNENENDVTLSDNELNKNSNGVNISNEEMKEWRYNENSDDDIFYDQQVEGNSSLSKNKKIASLNALSSVANNNTGNGSGETSNKIDYNVNQMQNRASQNKTFVYIKIPGAHHCISYKGPKNKNISDISQFTFKFPTLEYRNKTWSWYEFLMAVKKDLTKAVLNHAAALMREKIFKRKLNEKESNKMFGMLDEQIMIKFKKYYKNKSSIANNPSVSNVSMSTSSMLNENSIISEVSCEEDIDFIPEVNDELNLEYVEVLKKNLFNNDGTDNVFNLNNKTENTCNGSTDSDLHSTVNLGTPTNGRKRASTITFSKSTKYFTLPRDKSCDSFDGNFPVPIREANSRHMTQMSNVSDSIVSNSIQSINTFSAISNDYNEYMFIKKRMLFGKYMDDKI
ncbi:golgi-body localization protein domain-containing protein [Neocallimastix lanati (nom. inval.)]|nr:golgi-body localization protein domain-containing protein [Neocallimastix sp. JGI-2020a]